MVRIIPSIMALAFLAAAQPNVAAAQANQPKTGGRAATTPTVSGPINITTASVAELRTLPGIGAKTAERIVEYRQKNGPFKKVEELMNVRASATRAS